MSPNQQDHLELKTAQDILLQLKQLLSRNEWLHNKLRDKILGFDEMGYLDSSLIFPKTHTLENTPVTNMEIERQLQSDGFNFVNLFALVNSPDTSALVEDRSAQVHPSSPNLVQPHQVGLGDLEYPSTNIQRLNSYDRFEHQFPDVVQNSSHNPMTGLPFPDTQDGFQPFQDTDLDSSAASIIPPTFYGGVDTAVQSGNNMY